MEGQVLYHHLPSIGSKFKLAATCSNQQVSCELLTELVKVDGVAPTELQDLGGGSLSQPTS